MRSPIPDFPISIHALRVEGDVSRDIDTVRNRNFYPRPPGGGRQSRPVSRHPLIGFLSTPSGWRATFDSVRHLLTLSISIHALRVEGDVYSMTDFPPEAYFYPRPPGGGRLRYADRAGERSGISIHALRVEGDKRTQLNTQRNSYFYPRPPGGGRLRGRLLKWRIFYFYPRPPGGGRPYNGGYAFAARRYFYPRPPGGGRPIPQEKHRIRAHFYPRPPGGGRRTKEGQDMESFRISIHALRVEGDRYLKKKSVRA